MEPIHYLLLLLFLAIPTINTIAIIVGWLNKKPKSKHHSEYEDTGIRGNFMGSEYFPKQNISPNGPRPLAPPVPPGIIDKNLLPDPLKLEELAEFLDLKEWQEYGGSSEIQYSGFQEDLRTWAEYLRTIK